MINTDQRDYHSALPALAARDLVQCATAFLEVLGNIHRPSQLREATRRTGCAIEQLDLTLKSLDSDLPDTKRAAARTIFIDTARAQLPTSLRPHLDLDPGAADSSRVADMLTAITDLISSTASIAAAHHRTAGAPQLAALLDGVLSAASIAVNHASMLHTTDRSAR
ncbi:hypothetical protein ACL02S_23910 [Nocardia sp. 004]|uniref:hypothetical protein n=1 Tax=Nocardia sp. 004 TaxID=3385978 RepID=UPI0039A0704E